MSINERKLIKFLRKAAVMAEQALISKPLMQVRQANWMARKLSLK